jgi:putative transposase
MSRRGNCHDNDVAESFFHLLKREPMWRRAREEARKGMFDDIAMFYNPNPIDVGNGILLPAEFERQQKTRAEGVWITQGFQIFSPGISVINKARAGIGQKNG